MSFPHFFWFIFFFFFLTLLTSRLLKTWIFDLSKSNVWLFPPPLWTLKLHLFYFHLCSSVDAILTVYILSYTLLICTVITIYLLFLKTPHLTISDFGCGMWNLCCRRWALHNCLWTFSPLGHAASLVPASGGILVQWPGINACPLHWRAKSWPLGLQGVP